MFMGPSDFFGISECKCGDNVDLCKEWIKGIPKNSIAEQIIWVCDTCGYEGYFKYNMC